MVELRHRFLKLRAHCYGLNGKVEMKHYICNGGN